MLKRLLARFGYSPTAELLAVDAARNETREALRVAWAEVDRVGDELAKVKRELAGEHRVIAHLLREMLR